MKWTDQYEFLQLLAENRLEQLYSARDLMTNQQITIKTFKQPFQNTDEPMLGAQRTQQMSHPNLMNVYDIGRENQHHYITMETANGQSLREMIEEEAPLPVDKAIAVAIQICDALEYIHSYGLQHQQVWPQNIFCQTNGLSKILFHDIFDLHNELDILDHREMVPYLAPEQLQGFHVNESSDLYSLSIVLYEMITGHLPSTPNRDFSTFVDKQIFTAEFAGIEIPEPLVQVIRRGLSTRRYKRFQKATEMKQALFDVYYQVCQEDISVYEEVEDKKDSKQPNDQPKGRRRPMVYIGGIVAAIAFFVSGVYIYGGNGQSKPASKPAKSEAKLIDRRNHTLFDSKNEFLNRDKKKRTTKNGKNHQQKSDQNKWNDDEKKDAIFNATQDVE